MKPSTLEMAMAAVLLTVIVPMICFAGPVVAIPPIHGGCDTYVPGAARKERGVSLLLKSPDAAACTIVTSFPRSSVGTM